MHTARSWTTSILMTLTLLVGVAALALATSEGAGAQSRALAPYQQALRNAQVPGSCGHAAARLNGYSKTWPDNRGEGTLMVRKAIHGHLAGRSGWVTVVPYWCTAGGVSWPELILVYGAHARLIGSVDLLRIKGVQEHEMARRLAFVDGRVRFLFDGYEGCCFMHSVHRGAIGWAKGHRTFRHVGPLIIENTDQYAGTIDGPNQASWAVVPAPADLARFLQRRWAQEQQAAENAGCGYGAGVSLDRYSHKGFAMGDVGSCGGYQAVWAKVSGRWKEVLGYQESPTCASLTSIQRRAMTVLGQGCYRSGNTSPTKLGNWPRSGM